MKKLWIGLVLVCAVGLGVVIGMRSSQVHVVKEVAVKKGPTVCLNMIVKDETPVIRRCLQSVKPMIDYWVIVDTGSTDGTQQMIKEFMKDFPGELHERPWVNFGHNRNEALELANSKADYVLVIDADEVLEFAADFKKPHLDKDFYFIETNLSGTKYKRVQLINNHIPWKWVGAVHEVLVSDADKTSDVLVGITNIPRPDGNRSQDPKKFYKDIALLEKEKEKEPNNTRTAFYLAQSYRDAGEHEKAIEAYYNRVFLGGWDQEVFWSLLQIGILKETLKRPAQEIIDAYKLAYTFRPTRAEPLYRLANFYRLQGNTKDALAVATLGLSIKRPDDLLFVEDWIYEYGILLEYSVAAYWQERYVEALLSTKLMLNNPALPSNFRDCGNANMGWIHGKLEEQAKSAALAQRQNFEALTAGQ